MFRPTSERYDSQIPVVLRWLRCWRLEPGSAEFRWGQVTWNSLGLGTQYSVYHESANLNIHLLWLSLYVKVPVLITLRQGTEDWCASYGVHTFGDAVHCNWRTKCRILHYPWSWSHVRWSVYDSDGRQHKKIDEYDDPASYRDGRHVEKWPFVYVLRSGVIQNRTATIYGEEMEWRWRWFRRLPWPRMIKRSISVSFDDEVGERSGSWKGGVLGCSYPWRDGETMRGSLQRMQHEREFR